MVAAPLAAELRPERLRARLEFLASDLMEGRGPGQRGGDLAIAYLAAEMREIGLQPAGDNGTFLQAVPLVGVTARPSECRFRMSAAGAPDLEPKWLDDLVGISERQQPASDVAADVVFVGHAAVAPEEKWDDFAGVDVRGKMLLALVDDPPPTAEEPNRFGGKARTYYGRWTYKYEIARARGAAGALLIHTEASAGYGWTVVRNSWSGEDVQSPATPGAPQLGFAGWISEPIATSWLKGAGLDLTELQRAAGKRGFRARPLPLRFSATMRTDLRRFDTANLIGIRRGSPGGEAIVLSAHHDHLGLAAPERSSDRIFNGAVDNAVGVAMMLEAAQALIESGKPLHRDLLVFLAGAEEGGLAGSRWYSEHPVYPLERTAVILNVDSPPVRTEFEEIFLMGANRLDIGAELEALARNRSLTPIGDPAPDQGSFYRSDHFSFARAGVPAVNLKIGRKYRGHDLAWGEQLHEAYARDRYHQPTDDYDPSWELGATLQLTSLIVELAGFFGNRAAMPQWKPGDEFEAPRKRSLKAWR